jgi:hypothetical protein
MRTSLLSIAVLASASACEDDAAPQDVETPSRQFVFEGVRIEQRKAGELVWVAEAERSDGDLSSSDAQNVRLVHSSGGAKTGDYVITSPKGALQFDDGKADFADVRIVEPGGGVLTAGQAHYDEDAKRIYVDGPLDFNAPGLTVRAPKGEVFIEPQEVHVSGPVVGRFDPRATPSPPSPRGR